MKIKGNKNTITILIAAITALAGLVIYLITSLTGYLAASATNPWPVVCTVAALILLGIQLAADEKAAPVVRDLLTAGVSLLLLVSFYFFIMSRVQLAADVYFIPVNYPASEAAALHISLAGVALYLIADIAMITAAFAKRTGKE